MKDRKKAVEQKDPGIQVPSLSCASSVNLGKSLNFSDRCQKIKDSTHAVESRLKGENVRFHKKQKTKKPSILGSTGEVLCETKGAAMHILIFLLFAFATTYSTQSSLTTCEL